jgi:hypothetical protein
LADSGTEKPEIKPALFEHGGRYSAALERMVISSFSLPNRMPPFFFISPSTSASRILEINFSKRHWAVSSY